MGCMMAGGRHDWVVQCAILVCRVMKQIANGQGDITADFFKGNRDRLRQLFTGSAPIVLTAHGRLQMAMDESYPFHQDRNFWYLTGIDEPDVVLVLDKDKEYIIMPERSDVMSAFDGKLEERAFREQSGIEQVYTWNDGWKQLGARIKRVRHVATLGANQAYMEHFGMYANPARAALIKRMQDYNPTLELLDLRQHLARMRMIKQPIEMRQIQTAIDITLDSLRDATKPAKIAKYTHEYQIEAELYKGFKYRGAEGNAFAPIVASGQNACTLHYVTNSARLTKDGLVVLDVGAAYNHYSADISRTIVYGTPTRRQLQVHQAVQEAHAYAQSLLKPGVTIMAYERQMEQFMGEKLRELGLIKTIDSPSVRAYFPHATSHFMGLDTHDAGDYERPLGPDVVLTVEPGMYIPEEGIGVRIEDDVLITADGCRNLSERLHRELS